jgi:hypothetical protein
MRYLRYSDSDSDFDFIYLFPPMILKEDIILSIIGKLESKLSGVEAYKNLYTASTVNSAALIRIDGNCECEAIFFDKLLNIKNSKGRK